MISRLCTTIHYIWIICTKIHEFLRDEDVLIFDSCARLDDTLASFGPVDGGQVFLRTEATGLKTDLLVCFEARRTIHNDKRVLVDIPCSRSTWEGFHLA
jgi:hypothetical protein